MIAHVTSTIIGCARPGTNLDTTRYRSPSGRPPWAGTMSGIALSCAFVTLPSCRLRFRYARQGLKRKHGSTPKKGDILAGSPGCGESRRGHLQVPPLFYAQLSAITRSDQRCAASRLSSLRCSAESLPGSNRRPAAERRAGCRRCIAWQRSLSWTCRRAVSLLSWAFICFAYDAGCKALAWRRCRAPCSA